jgi:hypothetical protein
MNVFRAWINAPSPSSFYHQNHGLNGIAIQKIDDFGAGVDLVEFYPIKGNIISFRINRRYITRGWNIVD